MRGRGVFRSFVVGFWVSACAWAHVAPSEFRQWIKQGIERSPAAILEQAGDTATERARHTHYLFINGFLGERAHGSFIDNVATLASLGVDAAHLHVIIPSSMNSMEKNVELIREKVDAITQSDGDPLVLFAHSRGATEALAFALSAPHEIRDRMRAIFLVHGAFGGSPIADFLAGDGVPIDNRLPAPIRYVMNKIENAQLGQRVVKLEKFLRIHFGDGFLSLTHKNETAFWKSYFAENRGAAEALNDRIYYIRGVTNVLEAHYSLKMTTYYMNIYFGPNDGIIPLDYQMIEGLGSPLITLNEDHNFIIAPVPRTKAALSQRRVVTTALFLAAGRS